MPAPGDVGDRDAVADGTEGPHRCEPGRELDPLARVSLGAGIGDVVRRGVDRRLGRLDAGEGRVERHEIGHHSLLSM